LFDAVPMGVCENYFVVVDLNTCEASAPTQIVGEVAPNPECSDYMEISDAFRNVDYGYDFAETSFHVLTTDGIRGRDKVGDG
jgi:hypothetical protein